ncbi:LacI family DNA-binding transcriptional regulator [Cellulomonas shaoxiangyii]|uniref:LacI family transcriptional regulator n=1 Tax=Cellulomonas shaoxiangyii TaxID=2566013 RepID=A0A4P7SGH0_9CELL|nr:LacI family DNA-binding transcriptional regulator [Cellulomonas shaoxiangyii]QCB92577.1 LacI family transcriptional regulator [Cellulomonas shaoxiangyii]TGY82816.1 LacI family transcriptional regulator [Cellulomonas shaoxiangyii]
MASSVTLSDVAREAGVSLATASRAINGSANRTVRPDLRERVLEAAERLRYTPDANAQAMARGRTTSLGLVVHDIADPFFSSIAAGVTQAADRAALQVTLASTQHQPAREVELVRLLQRQRARAIVIAGGRHDDDAGNAAMRDALADFRGAGGAVALVGQPVLGVDTVAVDNAAGADALARALHARGYRHAGVLGGPEDHLTARERREAFTAAFAELGAPVQPAHVVTGEFTHEGGEAAMRELLSAGGDVDVVFAVNDVMALGALAAARDLGVRVPEDVALAGFDDILTLRDVVPPLTTVRVPLVDVGVLATELALEEHTGAARVRTVATEVVLRASTPDRTV